MEKQKILRYAGSGLLIALGLFLGLRVLLPLFLPFLLAFLLAAATEKPALYLTDKTRLPRPLAGGLCVLVTYGLLVLGLFFLGRTALRELGHFLDALPSWAEKFSPVLENVRNVLQSYIRRLPGGLSKTVADAADNFFKNGAGIFQGLPGRILGFVTNIVGKLPSIFLFLITTAVSSFMMAAQLPKLRLWLSRVLPKKWRSRVTALWHRCRDTARGWLTAELKLSAVTFLIVTAGMFLLKAPYPLLLGALIALVDLLPVLGTGTILLPWSLVLFLQGNFLRGAALIALYGVAAVTKASLEPRFLGKQMGLPPLLTLVAVYAGFRMAGFWGLLLFPMAAAVGIQIWRLAKKDPQSR